MTAIKSASECLRGTLNFQNFCSIVKSGGGILSAILTLSQLKEMTHAYDSFTTVLDSSLPEYYKEIFPKKCECGGEIILTVDTDDQYGFTQLQCCNPDCWIKMAHRFAYFAQSLGFKGFGATGALRLYRELHTQFKYPSFLYIFELPSSSIRVIAGDAYGDSFDSMKWELYNRGFQFKDAVAALGIPDLGKGSALFDIVKGPTVLLDFILKKRINELCDIAGINAPKSRFALEMFKLDVITLMHDVMPHILSTPKREVYVAITGSVTVEGKALTRAEFIWLCESLKDSKGEQAYKLVETKAESKLDYVIADAPSSSSKYSIGKRLGKLITADEFYALLKSQVSGGDSNEQ